MIGTSAGGTGTGIGEILARDGGGAALLAPGRAALSRPALADLIADAGAALNSFGLGRGDVVALIVQPGPEAATAFLAVAAHAVAAPLNPAASAGEIRARLADLEARAVILDHRLAARLRAAATAIDRSLIELVADSDAAAGSFVLRGRPLARGVHGGPAGPSETALILHTSGTTSQPKLVPLTAANLTVSAGNIAATLDLGPDDRALTMMPLFHIHGLVAGLLAPLASGDSVVVPEQLDAEAALGWMRDHGVTWYSAVPTIHQALLEAAARPGAHLPVLRLIRSSSAALPPPVLRRLEQIFDAPVIEAYGMTEASHQIASNPLPPAPRKPGSVGPADGTEVAVLDPSGRPLPSGRRGEIAIRGPTVTAGYLGANSKDRSGVTDGWLRTGDEGTLDAQGYLFITGRLKEMINRGGEKVAPQEVEEVLLDHPAVRQAVAFAVPHPSLGEDLVAAVVPRDGATAEARDLRTYVFARLAGHKVPSQVLLLDALPTSASGKLQRLQMAERLADRLQRDFVAPRGPLERIVLEATSALLGDASLGVEDNFFLRGGDSLKATRLAGRLSSLFGVALPQTTVFRSPTVAELTERISSAADTARLAELEAMVAEIEALSEAEARRLTDRDAGDGRAAGP